MNQWTVVQTVVVLIGLFITIGAPIIKLNTTITRLNSIVESLDKRFGRFEISNSEGHKRLWEKNTKIDEAVNDHEARIQKIESKKNDESKG